MKNKKGNLSSRNDLLLKMQINALYASFAAYIGCSAMPKLEIELQDWMEKLKSLNRIDFSTVTPKGANLFLLRTLRQNKIILGNGFKSHYYHEFTHIFDFTTLAQHLEIQQRRGYLKFYTEFHATQVALQIGLDFETYNQSKQINLTDKLFIDNNAIDVPNSQLVTVGEYMERLTNKLRSDIPLWYEKYEQEKREHGKENLALKTLFVSLLNQSIYYYAKIDFVKKHCSEDCSKLFDVNMFLDALGEEILKVYDLLSSGDISKEKLESLDTLSQLILNNFFEKMTGYKVPIKK